MKFSIFIFALISSVRLVVAQDFLPIESQDSLRTFALEQATTASASMYSNLSVGNNAWKNATIPTPTALGIETTIRNIPLSVQVANPKDSLYSYAAVYTVDWDVLFQGQKEFKLINSNGNYVLPLDYGRIDLSLAEEIPFKIENADSAQISLQNPNGETRETHSLRVDNGKVYFPRKLAGTNSILTVQTFGQDPAGNYIQGQLFWNVKNGGKITTQYFATPMQASIKGIVTTTDAHVNVVVPTFQGVGENKTLEYTSTKNATGFASFATSEGKWFAGAWVRKAKETEWVFYPSLAAIPGYKYVGFAVSANSIYYVVPKWNAGDLTPPADAWVPPVYDGGRG